MGNHGLQLFIVVLLAPLLACPVLAEPITPEVGLNEQLKALYKNNPAEALAAYKECKKHGDACHMPCTEISNCAGCHPEDSSSTSSDARVCGFCMPGYKLAEDKKSCTACGIGATSKGGRATSCSKCPPGQTTLQEGSHTCTTQQPKPAINSEYLVQELVLVLLYTLCLELPASLSAPWPSPNTPVGTHRCFHQFSSMH